MIPLLAAYVLRLADAARMTHAAADRPLYQALLADAAVLLATAVTGAPTPAIAALVRQHDRQHGHVWLAGPEHGAVADAWAAVTGALGPTAAT